MAQAVEAAVPHEAPAIAATVTGDFSLPTIGRQSAIEAVLHHMTSTETPAVLHLAGPPGSGRSQTLREAYHQVAERGALTILQSSPDPTGLATPLYPVRGAVAAVRALPPVCTRA